MEIERIVANENNSKFKLNKLISNQLERRIWKRELIDTYLGKIFSIGYYFYDYFSF